MRRESIYLDTSVPSAYCDNRTKERRDATIKFWKDVMPNYQVYVSEITVAELEETKDETLRIRFKELIEDFEVLKVNEMIRDLAEAYVKNRIFSERYMDDALHVAVASFYEVSYLVSWNFEHIVKVKTRRLVNSVNILEGFKEIEIVS